MNIQEIARLAHVSPATVSRVFSHHPSISATVRTKVLEIAREHDYLPRFSQRQKNVVILTPYRSVYPVQSCVDMLMMGLMQHLPEAGFRLEIVSVDNQDRLDSIQFCGAVAIGCETADFTDWDNRFAVPLIVMDRPAPAKKSGNIFFVHSDESQGMELAIRHFQQHRRRRIGCIVHGTPGKGNAQIRYQAILAALEKYGFEAAPLLMAYAGDGTEKYVELIGKMLRHKVDALFCPGGNAGVLGVYALSLFGRKIPEDIALIASEQTFYSQFAVPPQTTITPDYDGLAKAVVRILCDYLANNRSSREVVLPYHLIERETI